MRGARGVARQEIATRCVSESRIIAVVRCVTISFRSQRAGRPSASLYSSLSVSVGDRLSRDTETGRERARARALAGTIVASERSRRGQKAWII